MFYWTVVSPNSTSVVKLRQRYLTPNLASHSRNSAIGEHSRLMFENNLNTHVQWICTGGWSTNGKILYCRTIQLVGWLRKGVKKVFLGLICNVRFAQYQCGFQCISSQKFDEHTQSIQTKQHWESWLALKIFGQIAIPLKQLYFLLFQGLVQHVWPNLKGSVESPPLCN